MIKVEVSQNTNNLEIKPHHDTAWKKVKRVAFQALFWVGWTFVITLSIATVIPAAIIVTQKVRSYLSLKRTIEQLAINRHQAVSSALRQKLAKKNYASLKEASRSLEGTEKDKAKLVSAVDRLVKMIVIPSKRKSDYHNHMQRFRRRLSRLVNSPIYQANKIKTQSLWNKVKELVYPTQKNLLIDVLQTSSHALVSEAHGMKPLQELGEAVVGEIEEKLDYQELSGILTSSVSEYAVFKKNSAIGKLFWTLVHPGKAIIGFCDHLGLSDPLTYNSYEHGNASIQIGKYVVKKPSFLVRGEEETTYSLTQSPTFVADPLTEADRDYGAMRLVQDLEADYDSGKGERGRVAAKRRIADGNRLIHLNTPINLKNGKEPKVDLSKKLSAALDQAFEKSKLDPKRAAKTRRIAEVSLKALEVMVEEPFGVGNFYLNQSCKQNIDRGVVVNIATILFADAISGKMLNQERVHQLVGMLLARAGMVDDRAILKTWFLPLTDLIDVMHDNPQLIQSIQDEFTNLGTIAFNA